MADTDFGDFADTDHVQAGDIFVIVRGGVGYNFTGDVIVGKNASGNYGAGKTSPGCRFDILGVNQTITGLNFPGAALLNLQTSTTAATSTGPILAFSGQYGPSAGQNGTFASIKGALIGAGDGASAEGYFAFGLSDGFGVTSDVLFVGRTYVAPVADNAMSLGLSSNRYSVVYAGTGTINTSDATCKQQLSDIPDEWLDAWGAVGWCRFKFNDAVAVKGDEARWHVGLIAQAVRDAFIAADLDATAIGLLCFDAWDANGETPAGERWGLRYAECQAIEAAWQRREIARLAARLDALEGA